MRKLKKTKRIKKIKKTKKTRKFIRLGGGFGDFIGNMFSEPISPPIWVNRINNDNIYRVKIESCDYYFFGQNKKYVIIGHTKQIFKLDESAEDLPKETIDKIKAINFVELAKEDKYVFNRTIEKLAYEKILYFSHEECPSLKLDKDVAKARLIALNKSLYKKCNNLSLYIDYVYNHKNYSTLELFKFYVFSEPLDPYDLVLCLYKGKHCISSITIRLIGDVELDMASYTHPENVNKKYNTLLCCTLILISTLLSSNIQRIRTYALNPISEHIFKTYFGATLDDENYINVELNEENIQNAEIKFDEILKKITC